MRGEQDRRRAPVPESRATRLPLRGAVEITCTSVMPAARKRAAIASAALTVSPTESVVLISTSS
jgi:hypothetical protein